MAFPVIVFDSDKIIIFAKVFIKGIYLGKLTENVLYDSEASGENMCLKNISISWKSSFLYCFSFQFSLFIGHLECVNIWVPFCGILKEKFDWVTIKPVLRKTKVGCSI